MAQQTLDNLLQRVEFRERINENFTEVYGNIEIITNVPVSAAVSLDSSAYGKLHTLSGTSADYQVDLPTAVGHAGKSIAFKGLVGFTKVATLAGISSQTIDGDTTRKIGSRGIMVIQSDGANWILVHEVGSWIPWTSTFTGFSADPTNVDAKYFRVGNKIDVRVTMNGGTSGGGATATFTMTMPFLSLAAYAHSLLLVNNSASVLGSSRLAAGSNVLSLFSSATGNWSGVKGANFTLTYEKQ